MADTNECKDVDVRDRDYDANGICDDATDAFVRDLVAGTTERVERETVHAEEQSPTLALAVVARR